MQQQQEQKNQDKNNNETSNINESQSEIIINSEDILEQPVKRKYETQYNQNGQVVAKKINLSKYQKVHQKHYFRKEADANKSKYQENKNKKEEEKNYQSSLVRIAYVVYNYKYDVYDELTLVKKQGPQLVEQLKDSGFQTKAFCNLSMKGFEDMIKKLKNQVTDLVYVECQKPVIFFAYLGYVQGKEQLIQVSSINGQLFDLQSELAFISKNKNTILLSFYDSCYQYDQEDLQMEKPRYYPDSFLFFGMREKELANDYNNKTFTQQFIDKINTRSQLPYIEMIQEIQNSEENKYKCIIQNIGQCGFKFEVPEIVLNIKKDRELLFQSLNDTKHIQTITHLKIDMRESNFLDEECKRVAQMIQNANNLKILNLYLGSNQFITIQGIITICQAIKERKLGIRKLTISFYEIKNFDDNCLEQVRQLIECLGRNLSYLNLGFGKCGLKGTVLQNLAQSLNYHKNLRYISLDIADNGIDNLYKQQFMQTLDNHQGVYFHRLN